MDSIWMILKSIGLVYVWFSECVPRIRETEALDESLVF